VSVEFDPLNATYSINGTPTTFVDGKAESASVGGSETKIVTSIFGQPIIGDLNGDGRNDTALIIVQNPGGSGVFYYAAAAINTESGAKGTNAILLGDRIAPQNIEISNGQIITNYADRKPGEPMTTQPSVGVSKYFRIVNNRLTEIIKTNGAIGCSTNNDCQNGATCMVEGPLIANQPVRRVCVPKGQAIPL